MIPIPNGFLGGIIVLVFGSAVGIWLVFNTTKDKDEYYRTSGTVEYLELEYGKFPNRHPGDHRFLRVHGSPCIFDIFVPNSEPTSHTIDDLIIGDRVNVYHYKICDLDMSDLNRTVQFIDSDGKAYFIRNDFQKNLGYVIVGLSILVFLVILNYWRRGKIGWFG